jgi:hypothetical protein
MLDKRCTCCVHPCMHTPHTHSPLQFKLVAKLALFVALIGHGLSAIRLAILCVFAVAVFL